MPLRLSMPKRSWGAVLIAASILACAPPKEEEHAAPQPAPAAGAMSPSEAPSPAGYEPPGMTPQALQAKIKAGEKVAIVDVRSKTSYDTRHIEGAVSIPWRDLEKGYKQLPKDYLIALYCT